MCTDYQQAVITRLIATIPSNQHHIIMHLVLCNQIGAAGMVALEFERIAELDAKLYEESVIKDAQIEALVELYADAVATNIEHILS